MQFCMFCGAGLTPQAEKRRTESPHFWRTCSRCGQADQLNSKFCVNCSGKIVIPGEVQDSGAFRKFSWELEKLPPGESEEVLKAVEQPVEKRRKSPAAFAGWAMVLVGAVLGLCAGGGLALQRGAQDFHKIFINWSVKPGSIVIYTKHKYAEVLLEDVDNGRFESLETDGSGKVCIEPHSGSLGQNYRVRISTPGRQTMMYRFPVNKDTTAVIGFPKEIELPPASHS